ncbi:MAG: hypothetical protein K2W99_01630 [Chthoniobacterales bacterium]|nr:hypothetical protein [Chthoniobacterales bacterium]
MMPSWIQRSLFFLVSLFLAWNGVHAISQESKNYNTPTFSAPWTKPRQLSSFQVLLQHSPFSLSSIEESSPLSERYAITGIINLNGEDKIFIFDRNDQSHELVSKTPNEKAMALIAVIPQEDPNKLKATVSIGGETGTLSELEVTPNKPGMGPPSHFPPPNNKGPYPPGINPSTHKGNFYPPSPNYPSPAHYSGNSYSTSPHYSPTPPHSNDRRTITRPPMPNPPGAHNVPPSDIDDLD